ncbi:hypothetical protein N7490_006258 [Penicillium lividum]|nr:hypothetical protein N7490_006258 [Penicillium lividum]
MRVGKGTFIQAVTTRLQFVSISYPRLLAHLKAHILLCSLALLRPGCFLLGGLRQMIDNSEPEASQAGMREWERCKK